MVLWCAAHSCRGLRPSTCRRGTGGRSTVDSEVVDSLAFRLAVISVAVFIDWVAGGAIRIYLDISIARVVAAMFAGLIVKILLKLTPWKDWPNRKMINKIQGVLLR